MPCSVSREEVEHYDRAYNQKTFGVDWTTPQLTEAVACELSNRLAKGLTLDGAPGYVLGWIEAHNKKDAGR